MDVDRDERQEEQRIELGCDGEPQREACQAGAPVEKPGDARRRQRDRQGVEPGERELAEEERRRADEGQRGGGMADRGRESRERQGDAEDGGGEQRGHQGREGTRVAARGVVQLRLVDRVAVRRDERGQQEGRQRPGRVLDPEVAVGDGAVRHPVAERLVQRHVPRRGVVRPGPRERGCQDEQSERGGREQCEVAPRRRPPHGRRLTGADRRGTVRRRWARA